MIRLKKWAKDTGVSYETARRWASAGNMPVPVIKTETGQWLIDVDDKEPETEGLTVAYARVSSHDQKDSLDAQVGRIVSSYDGTINKVVTEIGSGMNPGRKKINTLLSDKNVTTIVVENKDRLARINTELIESSLKSSGRKVVYINDQSTDSDLVSDIIEFMTSACARLYGKRGAENRAKKALQAVQQDNAR